MFVYSFVKFVFIIEKIKFTSAKYLWVPREKNIAADIIIIEKI